MASAGALIPYLSRHSAGVCGSRPVELRATHCRDPDRGVRRTRRPLAVCPDARPAGAGGGGRKHPKRYHAYRPGKRNRYSDAARDCCRGVSVGQAVPRIFHCKVG